MTFFQHLNQTLQSNDFYKTTRKGTENFEMPPASLKGMCSRFLNVKKKLHDMSRYIGQLTCSDFCRRSLDCRRYVWACSISLSNKVISSGSNGHPCLSRSSNMDCLLSRNEGILSSGYLVWLFGKVTKKNIAALASSLLGSLCLASSQGRERVVRRGQTPVAKEAGK